MLLPVYFRILVNLLADDNNKQYDWLHNRLTEKFTSITIPPLPEK